MIVVRGECGIPEISIVVGVIGRTNFDGQLDVWDAVGVVAGGGVVGVGADSGVGDRALPGFGEIGGVEAEGVAAGVLGVPDCVWRGVYKADLRGCECESRGEEMGMGTHTMLCSQSPTCEPRGYDPSTLGPLS